MRRTIRLNIKLRVIAILLFLISILFFSIFSTISLGKELIVDITNSDNEAIDSIVEGEDFIVTIFGFNGTEFLVSDVNITFNNINYEISSLLSEYDLSLTAPYVEKDTIYTIKAEKGGFLDNATDILIKNIEYINLFVKPEVYTVKPEQVFSVRVTESGENGKPVPNAIVAIQNFGEIYKTDDDGRVWLKAPGNNWDNDRITVKAQKEGFAEGRVNIVLNFEEDFISIILNSPYFPIFIAIIFLITAIYYVNHRQKKIVYNRAKEISAEKTLERFGLKKEKEEKKASNSKSDGVNYISSSLNDNVRVNEKNDSKVEEIRISRPRSDKEIVKVEKKEDPSDKIILKKERLKRDYDWFEGTDDVRYEINKLTGEIDEEGLDKWFEGVDTLKDKINEKMKKKNKEKYDDENN